jgi:sugar phosphate isomerase/epimerase
MKIAFSTLGTPQWSWTQLIERGKAYGYSGVEIRLLEGETDLLARAEFQPDQLPARRGELAAAEFQVCGLASSVRFDDPDPSERERQLKVGRAYIDLAAALGAEFVRVFGDTLPPAAEEEGQATAISQVAEGLSALGDYGSDHGVRVLIETHGDFSDSKAMQAMMEQVECDNVGVLWDTHHPWRFCGELVSETFARLKPWIRHTHWKDSVVRPEAVSNAEIDAAAQAAHALMSGHRHADYVLFGGGGFPAMKAMQLLQWSAYDGWYSLEWEKAWHPEIEDPEIALPLFPEKIRQLASHCRG